VNTTKNLIQDGQFLPEIRNDGNSMQSQAWPLDIPELLTAVRQMY